MTIIRQKTKDNEEMEKIEKYNQKNVRIVYHSMCVCVCVCVCVYVFVLVIFGYHYYV